MKKVVIVLLILLSIVGSVFLGLKYRHNFLYEYQIKLLGDKNIEIPVNSTYSDEGVVITHNNKKVTDYETINNVDTKKVGNYEVIYKVQKVEKKRTISVVDKEKPILNFKENIKRFHIKNNDLKLEDLITVSDNYDKEIENNVKIETDFDSNKSGLYKVKYTVSDSSDNTSEIETTINVQEKDTNGIPVLMYHWFYDDTKGEKPGSSNSHNYLSKTEFEKQIKYLKDNNFYFPTWDELNDYIDGKIDLPKKSVILTDDDCVVSLFTVALPVLQKYEVPMTSYCITSKATWQNYIDEELLDFQSHTDLLHKRSCKGSWDGAVMCSSYDVIYKDIKTSVEKMKNNDSFAYPFGHYNNNTINALKENGIKLAFTINEGNVKRGANKYKLPRVRISHGTSISTYKKLVE